jgi:hypothetical protein
LALLVGFAPPASAFTWQPITCGMVLMEDAHLYLANDLSCPDFGVRITQEESGPGPVPHVVVDLRKHTLTGPGHSHGITAFGFPGSATVQVRNGRLTGWEIAVAGDTDTRIRNVALVGNQTGFFCNGNCYLDRSYFGRNSIAGLTVGGEGGAIVTRSTFVNNPIGARVRYIWSLDISDSVFLNNKVGVEGDDARVTVSRSVFARNGVGVLVTAPVTDAYPCAALSGDFFLRNGYNLVGPRC